METIEATIRLETSEVKKLMKQQMLDRHAEMVEKYGEACTKTTASKLISCSTQTINAMLKDGRIRPACGGSRVDVRSLADYIENRGEKNREARLTKSGRRRYV